MEHFDTRIHDKELAHRMALAEKPFRELAIEAIKIKLKGGFELASNSADEAGEKAAERYYEELNFKDRLAEVKELSDMPTVSATKSELAAFGVRAGFQPGVTTRVFKEFRNNGRVFWRYGLDYAYDAEQEVIRINDQVIAILPEVFNGKVPQRLVKEYYEAATGGDSPEDETP